MSLPTFTLKPLPMMLLCLATVVLTGCNDNDDDVQPQQLLKNSPLQNEPEIAAGAKTIAIHYAKLGPLQNAKVSVYDPIDPNVLLATGTTQNNGGFSLTFTKNIPQSRPLILEVEGGLDTDPDDNSNTIDAPIENKGKLHAIVFADDLLSNQSIIASPVTEIVYQRLQNMIGVLSPDDLKLKLNDISKQLLTSDITGNQLTDYKDILAFDPSKSEMHNKLFVSFSKYHQKLRDGKSFIEALRANDPKTLQYGGELLGSSAPTIDLPETNTADNVKLTLYVSGKGTLESALFKTGQRNNSEGLYQIAVPRENKEKYALTVRPDTGYKVVSWVGCSSLSEDQKTCLIKPDQSKSVYAVLAGDAVFKPDVKGHFQVPTNANITISDSAGVMTLSTTNVQLGASLTKLPIDMVLSLPYLPHPLVKVQQIVATVQNDKGTEIRFKFKDVQLTDVLSKATFYSTPTPQKPQVGLDDVVSVTVINDKAIVKDPKANLTDSRIKEAVPQTNSQTQLTPKYKDKSGGNHVASKAWELVIHKDRCVIYADDTPPTSRPTLPADPKNDTVWTSALRAAEGECNNKPLVYKPYKDYALDFKLSGLALNSSTNANHARFANMRYMQHMDAKDLANTPLYLISGNKKQGETVRTAAAWTWAKGIGPVLKVRKNTFLATKLDGRSGFELVSFEEGQTPQGNLHTVADFKCRLTQPCKIRDAYLPHVTTSKQVTHNPWYFGPNDPVPSPYKRAGVDTDNLLPLFGSDGLSVDIPFKNLPISLGIKTQVGVGLSVDWLWAFELQNAYAELKFIPEIAIEPRVELNLKASKTLASKEVTLIAINLAYTVAGPVASIIRPELTLNAGIEFGGEGNIYAAYTRGMKASFGLDAYYNADLSVTDVVKVKSHLKFPKSFETYKSVFEYGVSGQFYAEPYLELRLQGSVTGVAENLANLALRGFINGSAGYEAGAAVSTINKPEAQVRSDIERINNEYKMAVMRRVYVNESCKLDFFDEAGCQKRVDKDFNAFNSLNAVEKALNDKKISLSDANDDIRKDAATEIHKLYDKNYSAEFVNKIIDGTHNTISTRLSCRIGPKFSLDAGVRATASFNAENIELIGKLFDNVTVNIFEQRWPIQLKVLDDLNERAIECEDLDVPPVTDIQKNGTASLTWKENTNQTNAINGNSQYATIECGSWQDCQKQAAAVGARLAVVDSFQKNAWVRDNVITNKGKPAWIGLNSYTPENYYTWASGEAFAFNNWADTPSISGNKGVAMLVNGQWSTDTPVTRAIIEKITEQTTPEMIWKNNPATNSDYALVYCGTWKQCDALAKTVNARLASIGGATENRWIVNNILQNQSAWIGFNDLAKEGDFKWTVNESTTYNNWNSGEPNDVGNEDVAVMLGNGSWNDASINETNVKYAVFEKAGVVNWKYESGSAYVLIECETWQECQDMASSVEAGSSYLANIGSVAENKWIVDNLLSGKNAWIGLSDIDKEGQYRWTRDNTFFYSNWRSGEPNNAGEEDYVTINGDGTWNDSQATSKIGYAVVEKTVRFGGYPLTWKTNPTTGNEYSLVDCYSWTECVGVAKKANANLVTVRNDTENQWLINNVLNGQTAFIGLNRKGVTNHAWISLEAGANFRKWASNQPSNETNKDIVYIDGNGSWQSNVDYQSGVSRAIIEKGKKISVTSPIKWTTNNEDKEKHRYARIECGTWQECKTKAAVAGAYLAVISNLDEHVFVAETFSQKGDSWLGFSDIDADGKYKWVTGGDVFGSGLFHYQRDFSYKAGFDAGVMTPGGEWIRKSITDGNVKFAIFEQDDTTVINPPSTEESVVENPITWTTNTTNNTEYALIDCSSFEKCSDKAEAIKGKLVTIGNAEINKWLVDNVLKGQNALIGFNDIERENSFKWASGAANSYTNWNSGEPNNVGDEDAVIMFANNGKWNDTGVSNNIGAAIVERQLGSPAPSVSWKANNGTEYAMISCDSWRKCELQAKSMNANLVAIKNAETNKWLTDNISNGKTVWIGLNDIDQESAYKWTSGEAYSYTNWNNGEPNNYNEEDVISMLPNGKWNDESVNSNVGQAIIERASIDWSVNSANNHSYALIDCNTWIQCQAKAKTLGANLVTINDSNEQAWILSRFSPTLRYWIGFTDKDQEGVWKWISGENSSYTNWNNGEPNNYNNEDYAEVVENGKWNDSDSTEGAPAKKGLIEKN